MVNETEGFVESQGIKIHYISMRIHPNRETLLFVPGVMMPAWIWKRQMDYFSKEYNVVAIDPRSHGDSDLSTEGHYALAMAKDIKEVVEQLGLKRLVLVGWSLGVPQVVNYAALFGSEVLKGLVLVDGIVGIDPSVPFYQDMIQYWSAFQMDRVAKTRAFIEIIFKEPPPEAFLKKLTETALLMPTNTVMTLIYNYILQDFRPLLPKIDVPTLIATIEGPRLDYMRTLPNLLKHSRFELFKSSGHTIFVDQPEEFNRLLEEFIKELKQ